MIDTSPFFGYAVTLTNLMLAGFKFKVFKFWNINNYFLGNGRSLKLYKKSTKKLLLFLHQKKQKIITLL